MSHNGHSGKSTSEEDCLSDILIYSIVSVAVKTSFEKLLDPQNT